MLPLLDLLPSWSLLEMGPFAEARIEDVEAEALLEGPGCLKMPKLMDFLWDWRDHEMVWEAETWTQRTRYDCLLC